MLGVLWRARCWLACWPVMHAGNRRLGEVLLRNVLVSHLKHLLLSQKLSSLSKNHDVSRCTSILLMNIRSVLAVPFKIIWNLIPPGNDGFFPGHNTFRPRAGMVSAGSSAAGFTPGNGESLHVGSPTANSHRLDRPRMLAEVRPKSIEIAAVAARGVYIPGGVEA